MDEQLPSYLTQGESARLFPVLSTTSKEGRTTSIVLACLAKVDGFGRELLASANQKVGTRSNIESYTEIVPIKQLSEATSRPDGLIVLRVGSREWRAFVETKVGKNELDADQIESYRNLARANGIDCVITISNQFATDPTIHPVEAVRRSRSKVPVIHWSWMHVLTTADLLISRNDIAARDQLSLLNELRRFLAHESAGVRGFDRMPTEWTELNKLISSGGIIPAKSQEALVVLGAWHQEARDLSLILSRMTETQVVQRLPRNHLRDPALRQKAELAILRDKKQLCLNLKIPDAAASLEVIADLSRRCIDVGMTLRAPGDKKSSKARVNWLLRQIKQDNVSDDLHVRLTWPRGSSQTQHSVSDLLRNIEIIDQGKKRLAPKSFHLFESKNLGARFTRQSNFIAELEKIVPAFYGTYGANLSAWKKPAPKLKADKSDSADVSTEAIYEEADTFKS